MADQTYGGGSLEPPGGGTSFKRSIQRTMRAPSRVVIIELMGKRFFMAPNATELIEILDLVLEDVGPGTEALTLHWKFHDVDTNFRCKVTYFYSFDGETWTLGGDLGTSFWAAPAGRAVNKVEAAVTDVTTFGRHLRFKFHWKSNGAVETFATISAAVAVKSFGQ
jgi:hypothetical protein